MFVPVLLALLACSDRTRQDRVSPPDDSGEVHEDDTAVQGTTCPPELDPEAGQVLAPAGVFRGVREGVTWTYKGIPYAQAPSGSLRWRPPQPLACDPEPFEASSFGAVCPQLQGGELKGSEDCLSLNIWTAARPGDTLPVLFYLHGGGNELGSGGEPELDSSALASEQGVVVVTSNYRLSTLGFLGHPALAEEGSAGNLALQDNIAALRWIQDNIAAFGGDPHRVLIVGQSAGGMAACRLLVSPQALGLFSGAVMQSGGCRSQTEETAQAWALDFAEARGCGPEQEDPAACLRALPLEGVMPPADGHEATDPMDGHLRFDGVVDGLWLPDSPGALIEAGQYAAVPVLRGSNGQETGERTPTLSTQGQLYAGLNSALDGHLSEESFAQLMEYYPAEELGDPTAVYVAVTTDLLFTCPARADSERLAAAGLAPVWRYRFDEVPDWLPEEEAAQGATHGINLFFQFSHFDVSEDWSAPDRATRDTFREALTLLAAGEDLAWSQSAASEDNLVVFAGGAQATTDDRAEACALLDTLRP